MYHRAELSLHRFLDQATDGEKVLSDANIDKIAEDIKEAKTKIKTKIYSMGGYDIFRL